MSILADIELLNRVSYLAVPRAGDIIGMTRPGEEPETFVITTKSELALWRAFNKANKFYLELCSEYVEGGCKGPRYLLDYAGDMHSKTSEALRDHLGEEIFSKWHARTTWVCKKVK